MQPLPAKKAPTTKELEAAAKAAEAAAKAEADRVAAAEAARLAGIERQKREALLQQERICQARAEELQRLGNEHAADQTLWPEQDAPVSVDPLVPERSLNELLAVVDEQVDLERRLIRDGAGATILVPPGSAIGNGGNKLGSTRSLQLTGSAGPGVQASMGGTSVVPLRRGSLDRCPDSSSISSGFTSISNPALVRGSRGEPSPLTPGLGLATRLLCASSELETVVADAVEARDSAHLARAQAYLARLRGLVSARLDTLTWCMIQSAGSYAVETKDGMREIVVSDAFGGTPADNKGSGSSGSNNGGMPANEVLLWASVGPGKPTRLKTVQSGIAAPLSTTGAAAASAALSSSTARRRSSVAPLGNVDLTAIGANFTESVPASTALTLQPTLTVDLPKQVASLNAALRVVRTSYDYAREAAVEAAVQSARIASELEAYTSGGGSGARPRSGAKPSTGGPSGSLNRHGRKDSKPAAATAAPAGGTADVGSIAATEAAALPRPLAAASAAQPALLPAPSAGIDLPEDARLRVLGDVITLELLQLPEAPVTVGDVSMTRYTPAASPAFTVQRLPHPTPSQAATAIKVRFAVRPGAVVPTNPVVARWQPGAESTAHGAAPSGRWVSDGVFDVSWDSASRLVTFRTLHTGAHALVQPRFADLPYTEWTLTPAAAQRSRGPAPATDGVEAAVNTAVLAIRTLRFAVAISVEGDRCRLLAPCIPELAHLLSSDSDSDSQSDRLRLMPPGQLLAALSSAGIHLMPADGDRAPLNSSRERKYAQAAEKRRAAAQSSGSADSGLAGNPSSSSSSGTNTTSSGSTGGGGGMQMGPQAHNRRGSDADSILSFDGANPLSGSGSDPSASSASDGPAMVITGVTHPLPVAAKDRALEEAAYVQMAQCAAALCLQSSKWSCVPSCPPARLVLRAREVAHDELPNVAYATAESLLADTAEPTAWRNVDVRVDCDAAGRLRVALTTDRESEAAAEWAAATTVSEGMGGDAKGSPNNAKAASGGATPVKPSANGEEAAANIGAPSGPLETAQAEPPAAEQADTADNEQLQPAAQSLYRGVTVPGTVSHNTMRRALERRASPEAAEALARADPGFTACVLNLLRLVRPLGFGQ